MQPQLQNATLVRASHLRVLPKPAPRNVPFACRHAHRMLITIGSVFFSAGELIDTIHTVSVCLSCGEEFPALEGPAA